jgi:hypothetical protein
MKLPQFTVTLDTRMTNLAIAALRYLEARDATVAAKHERAKINERIFWTKDKMAAAELTRTASDAHRAVLSAGARQAAAMRWMRKCAKQMEGVS